MGWIIKWNIRSPSCTFRPRVCWSSTPRIENKKEYAPFLQEWEVRFPFDATSTSSTFQRQNIGLAAASVAAVASSNPSGSLRERAQMTARGGTGTVAAEDPFLRINMLVATAEESRWGETVDAGRRWGRWSWTSRNAGDDTLLRRNVNNDQHCETNTVLSHADSVTEMQTQALYD